MYKYLFVSCRKTLLEGKCFLFHNSPTRVFLFFKFFRVVPNHSHRLEDQSHSYSTSMTDRQSKPSPRAEANSGDSADVGVKCKNMKRERHRETRIRNNVCKGKNDGKKRHHRGRHCRCRRRCLECRQAGKVLLQQSTFAPSSINSFNNF